MDTIDLLLLIFAFLVLLASLIPLVRHEYWIFRVFDYPRLQKFTLTLLLLVLVCCFFDGNRTLWFLLLAILAANAIYLGSLIFPFTPFAHKQVLPATGAQPENTVRIMIANVYQDNRNYAGCLAEIRRTNPDIVLLLETDEGWAQHVSVLAEDFPHSVLLPIDNTYGMLLYSKLELQDAQVKFLVEKEIPSVHTNVVLRSGQRFRLFAIHPTPPVPNENPRSTERDKELLLVADLAKDEKLPVVVIGDLNDVAWSYTTELFLKMSQLLDPRRGRGFFNSFHAHYPFLRFPLDHAFISSHWKLREMRRLKNFDSDHFPIFIALQFEKQAEQHQEQELQPDAEDVEIAEEKKAAV